MTSPDVPIPGSVLLVDESMEGGAGASSQIVLHPRPSNDVNDPLNWTNGRKQLHFASLLMYTFTVGIGVTALYSVLTPVSEKTGISVADLNSGTGTMFLFLGWGGLITQPLALTFGRRPVYIISQIAHIAVIIWMAFISSSPEWIGNKVIQGLVCSPVEMLVEHSISDLFFAHERGFYIGIYALALFGSNYVAPLISGFINDGLGYRYVFYISAIIQGVGLVWTIFLMEETAFVRHGTEETERHTTAVGSSEKDKELVSTSIDAASFEQCQLIGTPKTYLQRLRLFNGMFTSLTMTLKMVYRPLLLLQFPVIFWCGFMYGAGLVWYSVLNATASSILSAAPYNFSSSGVGLIYLGPLVGVCFGAAYSGWFGDKYSLWQAKKSRGIREPEDRLWLLAVTVLLVPASLILWGVGAGAGVSYGGLAVGAGMSSFCSAVTGSLTIGYLLDSYKDLGGEALISIILVRNTLNFAIGYGITPWLNLGLRNTFISAAFVGLAISASFLIMIKWGKHFRASSKEKYWAFVASAAAH